MGRGHQETEKVLWLRGVRGLQARAKVRHLARGQAQQVQEGEQGGSGRRRREIKIISLEWKIVKYIFRVIPLQFWRLKKKILINRLDRGARQDRPPI